MTDEIKLMAWQFTYLKGEEDYSFETIPFYLKTLRNFLRENLGKVVWIKGAIKEKPAYLLFYSELAKKVADILIKPLKDGGQFGVIPVKNPLEITRKYLREERLAVGYLDLQTTYIGSRESLVTPKEKEILEKMRGGFMLTEYQFIKADDVEIKRVGKEDWAILRDVVEVGVKSETGEIAYVHRQPQMGLRVKDLKFHPTQLKSLDKDSLQYKLAQANMQRFKKFLAGEVMV